MRRNSALTPLTYAVTLVFVLIVNCSSATSAIPDPVGDAFGTPTTAHDLSSIDAFVSSTAVTFIATFVDPIAAPSAFSPNSVVGYIDLDLDRNPRTGAFAKKSLFSPIGDSELGAEFHVDLFSERFHAGEVDVINNATVEPVGTASIDFQEKSFVVTLPLALILGDTDFNYGAIVGDYLDMSDEAPDRGFATVPEPCCALTGSFLWLIAAFRAKQRQSF
ncbi:MAG: hypothetical protein R3E01_22260 [Pirellulaceae bacterium]|nr:hypothetical protein [Planctomycetales bacterium]